MVDVTNYEQLFLELINRDRADPVAAAEAQGYELNDGVTDAEITDSPKQPLAFIPSLLYAATDYSRDQVENDFLSHLGLDGSSPNDRVLDAGYTPAPDAFYYYIGENIAGVADSQPIAFDTALVEFMHDNLFDSPLHRVNILEGEYSEIGIGSYTGPGDIFGDGNTYSAVATENFADGGRIYITGVVFMDRDGDEFYDIGEGLGDIKVTIENRNGDYETIRTFSSGGYTLESPSNGEYTVTFSGAGLSEKITKTVYVDGENVKVDAFASLEPAKRGEVLLGTGGGDQIYGLGGPDTISGYRGNDFLVAGAGNDQVFGGNDQDLIFGSRGNDTLNGDNGDDVLIGGTGNDHQNGGDGGDIIYGEKGNDHATGGNGGDYISGEDGRDLIFGQSDGDTLKGGGWSDTVSGGDSADIVNGNSGNDILSGNNGHDTVSGGSGNDSVDGNRGRDELAGGTGNDTVNGGAGTDTLTGNDGRDMLNGGSASDRLYGGDGRDTLNGGAGNDTLSGGSGADLYVLEPGTDVDTVVFDGRDSFDLTAYNFTNAAFQSIYNNATGGSGSTLVLDLGGGDELRVRVDAGVSDPLLSDFMI